MPSFPNWTFEKMGGALLRTRKTRLGRGKDTELIMEMLGLGLLSETRPRFGCRDVIESSSERQGGLKSWRWKVLPWEGGRKKRSGPSIRVAVHLSELAAPALCLLSQRHSQ